MNIDEFELLLALTPGVGSATAGRIMARIQSDVDSELLESKSRWVSEFGLPERSAAFIASRGDGSVFEGTRDRLRDKSVKLITQRTALYPVKLAQICSEVPSFLFAFGNLDLLKASSFCVLASRDVDEQGCDRVEAEVEKGVLDSLTLVTGANTPAYQRAAIVPLRWGAPRILILDRGLFEALGANLDREPFPAARLWRYQFDAKADLAITRFRPNDHGTGSSGRLRDEMVVGLADDVRVAHCRSGGIIETLANRAVDVGRRVTFL
jgi:DNA processing protein